MGSEREFLDFNDPSTVHDHLRKRGCACVGWGGGERERESFWILTFRQPYMITSGRECESLCVVGSGGGEIVLGF